MDSMVKVGGEGQGSHPEVVPITNLTWAVSRASNC